MNYEILVTLYRNKVLILLRFWEYKL